MSEERDIPPATAPQAAGGDGEQPAAADGSTAGPDAERRSLLDDIEDLVFDARTWLDAELSYQKTRAAFIGSSLKQGLALGAVAALLALVALIALTVGLLIALAPLVTPWGATAIVVGLLLAICLLLLGVARRRFADVREAINEGRESAAPVED